MTRHISNTQIIETYRSKGCQAAIDLYTTLAQSQTLIVENGLASEVFAIMEFDGLNKIDRWNRISETISDASIKLGFE